MTGVAQRNGRAHAEAGADEKPCVGGENQPAWLTGLGARDRPRQHRPDGPGLEVDGQVLSGGQRHTWSRTHRGDDQGGLRAETGGVEEHQQGDEQTRRLHGGPPDDGTGPPTEYRPVGYTSTVTGPGASVIVHEPTARPIAVVVDSPHSGMEWPADFEPSAPRAVLVQMFMLLGC